MKGKRILIAIDGSSGSSEALETGLALARAADAIATLVYVRRRPRKLDRFYQCTLIEELVRARAVVAEAEARAAETGVESESEILEGHPAGRIVELAQARGADLIVIGSHGRGAVAGALVGSVSTEIVHKADRPVLIAKQRSRARRVAA